MERQHPRDPRSARHPGRAKDSRSANDPRISSARNIRGGARHDYTSPRVPIAKRVPFFANLSDAELRAISRKFADRRFKRGEYVFREGDPSCYLYAIRKGHIKVFKESPEGKRRVLEILTSGDVCGASGVLSGTQIASAQAVEDTETHAMSREDFLYLLDTNRGLAKDIIAFLGKRLVKLHEMVINFASGRVEQRIASLLLGLSERHGTPVPGGIRIDIRLTRQDMADIVGTTVETSIRVISKFRRKGIIAPGASAIVITDREALRGVLRGPAK